MAAVSSRAGPAAYVGLGGERRMASCIRAAGIRPRRRGASAWTNAGSSGAFIAHLGWLAGREARAALSIGARALANAFADHDLELPLPAIAPPDRPTQAGPPFLIGARQ